MVDFLLALLEFDGRRLWADLGFGSLFDFLHRELGMSTGAAFYRKTAVRLLHMIPDLVEPLRDGRLCVSSLPQLAKVVTPENYETILPKFFHRSTREAKEVSAALAPHSAPPHRDVVTVVAPPPPAANRELVAAAPRPASPANSFQSIETVASPGGAAAGFAAAQAFGDSGPGASSSNDQASVESRPVNESAGARGAVAQGFTGAPSMPASRNGVPPNHPPERGVGDSVEPLTAELRRLHITVSRSFLQKLDAARALLSHRHPAGRAEDVLEAALDLLLDHRDRKKARSRRVAARSRPAESAKRPGTAAARHRNEASSRGGGDAPSPRRGGGGVSATAPSKHIPARIEKAVRERDGNRCQFKLHDGRICGSTVRLEIDHITPRSMNGPPTLANLRLLCREHNQLAARRMFGDSWMEQFGSARNGKEHDARAAGRSTVARSVGKSARRPGG